MKKMAMLLAAGCAIGMLTGCGVPEEEHLAIIDGINKEHQAEVDKLNVTIGDQKDLIKSKDAKARANLITMDDNAQRIKDLQQKSAETSKALATEKSSVASLESQLKTAKSQVAAAQDDAMEAENKYSTLDVKFQELERRFEMYRKNMSALDDPAEAAAPAADASAPAVQEGPATDAQKASNLLDQMGTTF